MKVVRLSAVVGLSLKSVMVSVASWPALIGFGEKLLLTRAGEFTVKFALALAGGVKPRVLPTFAASKVLVNVCVPAALALVPMTSTNKLQLPERPTVPPVSVKLVVPAAGANVPLAAPVPLQLTLAFGAQQRRRSLRGKWI